MYCTCEALQHSGYLVAHVRNNWPYKPNPRALRNYQYRKLQTLQGFTITSPNTFLKLLVQFLTQNPDGTLLDFLLYAQQLCELGDKCHKYVVGCHRYQCKAGSIIIAILVRLASGHIKLFRRGLKGDL